MVLNSGFLRQGKTLVNYDYFDISDGIGYDVFYGFNAANTTGTSTRETIYSGLIHHHGSAIAIANDDVYDELHDVDFDILFQRPKNVKGNILIQVPFGIQATSTGVGSVNFDIKATCEVFHYDGSSETQMGSTQTSEELIKQLDDDTVIGAVGSHITTFIVNQATTQHFKAGETLRFTIKIFAKHTHTGVASALGGVGCDPLNRTDFEYELVSGNTKQVIKTDDPTQMAFHVPFKLNVDIQ